MGRLGTVTLDFPDTGDTGLVSCTMEARPGYTRGPNCEWIPETGNGGVIYLPPPTANNTVCLVGRWNDALQNCVTDNGYVVDTRVTYGNPVNPGHVKSDFPWWLIALLAVGGIVVLKKS